MQILNGTKRLVINGESADIFIVYARTNFNNVNQCDYTAFILERSMGGIITKSTSTSSLDNTDICEVSFKDVQVPIGVLERNQRLFFSVTIYLHYIEYL